MTILLWTLFCDSAWYPGFLEVRYSLKPFLINSIVLWKLKQNWRLGYQAQRWTAEEIVLYATKTKMTSGLFFIEDSECNQPHPGDLGLTFSFLTVFNKHLMNQFFLYLARILSGNFSYLSEIMTGIEIIPNVHIPSHLSLHRHYSMDNFNGTMDNFNGT
jgi:hypothetical protein